ncbi:hypothetical protein G6F39_010512 [Rhizopus arrhizus]|nr:hypothetical protein G6F39_010512 [Rhizopus arrhizus]
MYAQFSGLFSSLLLLTTLVSGLSAAVCFLLSGVPTGDLLLTAFLLLINSWSLVLCRNLPPSKGADSTLTSIFNRLHSVPRKTSLSTSTRKRTRIKAADVHWCIDNVANLSVQTFAITFKHYDRQHCHSRYNITLDSHIPEEHRSRLQDEFETWRKIIDCTEFWRNQRRAQALAEANDNCSEAANNFLISNTQEIKSSVAKYHVPEPAPVTMTLQAPTTPVGHPGTSVPPVLATTGTPVSQSLSPSMADTLV